MTLRLRFWQGGGSVQNCTVVGDYRLATGSPCLNSGSNELWMVGVVDLDRRPRRADGGYPARTNRCVDLSDPDAVFSGFPVSNGYNGGAAGIYINKGTVEDCTIVGNAGRNGNGQRKLLRRVRMALTEPGVHSIV